MGVHTLGAHTLTLTHTHRRHGPFPTSAAQCLREEGTGGHDLGPFQPPPLLVQAGKKLLGNLGAWEGRVGADWYTHTHAHSTHTHIHGHPPSTHSPGTTEPLLCTHTAPPIHPPVSSALKRETILVFSTSNK